eukprot:CAMPEP_0202450846 /NCGR_PEP_ID=MMETSP1360-20130828/9394_1 /ASSEMBLY_ACC=CAM_ASM_000848 /TAXON_ID=515479 /ORGANISM="Licmophora paradoxa, Strain CCMP2313" /LENGTH=140 /DNA_ID=CAMNT_0049069255 /DNA_START=52 /DNA_END=471 /DNA_ORIENTATION=+
MKRFIRPDIENEIISRITDAMQRQGRKEDLIIFNGFYPGGQRMTSYEQFLLFKDATTIIGPHGSGISGNLLWTNPKPRDCDDRVKVLEFIGGRDTISEASPDDVNATVHSHWLWMRGWPLDYHHIMYAPNSTREELIIDL